jgi:hypothetical protein
MLAEHGIVLEPQYISTRECAILDESTTTQERVWTCTVNIKKDDQLHGTIRILTIFSDGIARCVDTNERTYFNVTMSTPAWFYEEHSLVALGGTKFRTYREPEIMCAKVFGPDWRAPRDASANETTSPPPRVLGLEGLLEHALSSGWDTKYSDRPNWPVKINIVSSQQSKNWLHDHEPLLRPDLPHLLRSNSIRAASWEPSRQRMALYLALFTAKALRYAASKERQKIKELKDEAEAARRNVATVQKRAAQSLKSTAELKMGHATELAQIELKHAEEVSAQNNAIADLRTQLATIQKRAAQSLRTTAELKTGHAMELAQIKLGHAEEASARNKVIVDLCAQLATIRSRPFRFALGRAYRRLGLVDKAKPNFD